MPVRILDEHLINKIAAGEVVERPASVLKELVENALDAGATDLRVHLRAGGRTLVKVIDNGSGMSRTDALMCIERHATSKIRTDDDLFRVSTLGFRGEAIPSIASVSRFTLLTRPNGDAAADDIGTCVELEGGKLLDVRDAGCAPGTEITVSDLFFNVPARRKFLRSVDTELGHCVEAVTRVALIRPDLDVEVQHEDRTLLRCAPTDAWGRRAADLLGPHGEALLPVTFTRGTLEVRALISPVGVHRAQPTGSTWTYVNGRFVRDLTLRRALAAAYAGIVPKDRYPLVILDVRVPPADVDVNVHPAKTEVRFAQGFELQNAVTQGLRAALQEHGIQRPVAASPGYRPAPLPSPQLPLPGTEAHALPPLFRPPPAPAPRPSPDATRVAEPAAAWQPPDAADTSPGVSPLPASPVTAPEAARHRPLLPVPRFADLRVIGQLNRTYILCEGHGELVILDQHAAAERITLYRLTRDRAVVLGGVQQLLTPRVVRIGAPLARALAPEADALAGWGMDVRALGGDTFAVHALPGPLARADVQTLLEDVAAEIAAGARPSVPEARLDHFLSTLACHTSIRAGDALGMDAMQRLLSELDDVDFAVCAHGRPVLVHLSATELERRFHR